MAISLAKTALLFLLCATTTGAQAPSSPLSLTDADEIRLGQAIADDFVAQEGMQPTPQTRKIDDYLQSVGDRVTAHARRKIPYRFHFDPSPSFRSAVGLPGGQVFVGAGILAYMDSEDQLAMVLGHEVEHIDLNQCRDRLIKVLSEQHLTVSMADKLKVDPFLPGYGREGELAKDHAEKGVGEAPRRARELGGRGYQGRGPRPRHADRERRFQYPGSAFRHP